MRFIGAFLLVCVSCLAVTAEEALDRAGPVAFLGVVFLDTSTEGDYFGERPEERARVALLERTIRDRLQAEGFMLADLAPIRADLDNTVNPANCYGCEVRMAEKAGARYVVVGMVQKVSNLILSMNLVMRSVPDGAVVRARSADIRSNTDDSWLRGMNYILKTAFFTEGTR
ncbi:DUF3280 domain-containing protein [Sulfitobacter sp. D35]|uniref:DUF3280 domain-containing protein n=1 Tax=Sulfitobacter sp. D35 TaxID=3083252 RepID=UPI00296EE469|nr:DUF3280 domain-containing protein [Sulfitobacter sp. D35]MDW4498627.1 DUF3280 domain-containing protein [Sulfitobacter sp. D35]